MCKKTLHTPYQRNFIGEGGSRFRVAWLFCWLAFLEINSDTPSKLANKIRSSFFCKWYYLNIHWTNHPMEKRCISALLTASISPLVVPTKFPRRILVLTTCSKPPSQETESLYKHFRVFPHTLKLRSFFFFQLCEDVWPPKDAETTRLRNTHLPKLFSQTGAKHWVNPTCCWWKKSCKPVEVVGLSHYLQGFIHPRWLALGFLSHH